MTQRYTLYAGHRDVEVDIRIDGASPDATFCTGIQKLERHSTGFMQEDGLCGSWGNNVPEKSTPEHDEWVGLGLYTDKACRKEMKEDEFNYLPMPTSISVTTSPCVPGVKKTVSRTAKHGSITCVCGKPNWTARAPSVSDKQKAYGKTETIPRLHHCAFRGIVF